MRKDILTLGSAYLNKLHYIWMLEFLKKPYFSYTSDWNLKEKKCNFIIKIKTYEK